jgi:DnaA family protein
VLVTLSAIQLPLGITLSDGATFASYYPGPNAAVVAQLPHILEQGGDPVYLWGKAGVGKSHLLQAACRRTGEAGRPAAYLPLGQADLRPEILEGLEGLALIAVDDIEARAGDEAWEAALFHLYNRLRQAHTPLLMSAAAPPQELSLRLPDLASRLSWGLVFQLKSLADEDRLAALRHRARGRGLMLPPEVGWFLLHRYPRDMAALFSLLDRLDAASLAAQRRLTVPFVKSVLE